ncbi:hypothetical protein L1887_15332 [Cichorium endivia]|nr:hypothetical protein L1887_15332 [Cichorium endivia]
MEASKVQGKEEDSTPHTGELSQSQPMICTIKKRAPKPKKVWTELWGTKNHQKKSGRMSAITFYKRDLRTSKKNLYMSTGTSMSKEDRTTTNHGKI